ncbi:MAG TPA: dihydrolipoyl dehydrogenase [Candidatus Binataceae bacterium]|nr:dihydrolipoyl dehydrogenase [Candidatus Binataceae bacterium]
MANSRYDLAIIGSGPGGYVAAIRASQLKMKVAIVERDRPGGVCLNWGCIPSKALLNSAEVMEEIRGAAKEHGIQTGEVSVDFKRVIQRSREAADKLQKGVRFLLKKNNVDLFEASATIASPNSLALAPADGKSAPALSTIEADKILIAAGSGERLFLGMKIGDGVMTSKEALLHDRIPSTILIIGAGAIGLEFGYFYQAFGSQVTIVELEKQMLPGFDAEIAEELRRNFLKRKVSVLLGHAYKSMVKNGDVWSVTVNADGADKNLEAENVLVAVGRVPLSKNLGIEKVGVELEKGGFIKVNDSFRTTCKTIFAIGDVIRPPLLAHKASAEGIAAVEIMAGAREPGFDLLSIAGCIYCEPEVATVGLTEADAKAAGLEVKVGKFPFRAIGKAIATNSAEGFVKFVVSKQYGEVLGCQIIGHHATDLISEVVLGKTLEATNIEFGKTVHPHPTMSEAIMEAALAVDGEAIHI